MDIAQGKKIGGLVYHCVKFGVKQEVVFVALELSLPASVALCNFPVSLDYCELNHDNTFQILWSRYVLKCLKTL